MSAPGGKRTLSAPRLLLSLLEMLILVPALLAALSGQLPLDRESNSHPRWFQFHSRPSWTGGRDVRYLANLSSMMGGADGVRIWVTYDWHGSLQSMTEVELWEFDCRLDHLRVVEALGLGRGELLGRSAELRNRGRPIAQGSAEAALAAIVCSPFR